MEFRYEHDYFLSVCMLAVALVIVLKMYLIQK